MTLHRRSMLRIPVMLVGPIAAPAAATAVVGGAAQATSPGGAPDLAACEKTFTGLLDTLLPAAGDSPAASSLGLPQQMLEMARAQPSRARLLAAGCDWLDRAAMAAAGKRFEELDEVGREALVTAAQAAAPQSLQARFFFITHRDAMELFYADAKAWPALHYAGPPQPAGFMDHAGPWKRNPG